MFARVQKSGKYQYLQIVEDRKIKGKVKQRVIATIGRMDRLQEKDRVETLIRSLSRFSEKAMLIFSGRSDVSADAVTIGPVLIFERLWQETGIHWAIEKVLAGRKFEFDVERAIFLTVLHRLMVSGSDRFCAKWRRDYRIEGTEHLDLYHLYRAMGFLGEELQDQKRATPFSSRCTKDHIEELLFNVRRYLKMTRGSAGIDMGKIKEEARFDGKWVLTTNTDLSARKVVLKYKELWQVERVFRDIKTLLETRPIFHQRDENIRGHVFCSFLALVLRKELERRLNHSGHMFEWSDIKQELEALRTVTIEEGDKRFAIRTECRGNCGKIFQAVGVALPPTIREIA